MDRQMDAENPGYSLLEYVCRSIGKYAFQSGLAHDLKQVNYSPQLCLHGSVSDIAAPLNVPNCHRAQRLLPEEASRNL